MQPISHPSDIILQPAMASVYTGKTIENLASKALAALSAEHDYKVKLTRLLSVFLGDDVTFFPPEIPRPPSPILSEPEENGIEVLPKRRAASAKARKFEHIHIVKEDQVAERLGLTVEQTEEARRTVQAALERSQEFVRCLNRIRMTIVKAGNMRDQIWEWCQDSVVEGAESDGSEEEEDDEEDEESGQQQKQK